MVRTFPPSGEARVVCFTAEVYVSAPVGSDTYDADVTRAVESCFTDRAEKVFWEVSEVV